MRRVIAVLVAVAVLTPLAWFARPAGSEEGSDSAKRAPEPDHIMFKGDDLKWGPGPASLPAGAEVAVLEGDMSKEGPFTIRIKLPAGWKVMPHTHPAIEHVTVLSGSFAMGTGEKFDEASMMTMPAGGFAVMKTGAKHFGSTKDGCVIQTHGMGPWGITYVNPADDPRKK
jgi:anti-sigma factor ChrR (cupin superfamily)